MSADIPKQDVSVQNIDIPLQGALVEGDNVVQQDEPMKEEICENPELASSLFDNPTFEDVISQQRWRRRQQQQVLHRTEKKKQFKPSITQYSGVDTDVFNQILDMSQNITDEIIYHHNICRNEFYNRMKSLSKKPVRTVWLILERSIKLSLRK